MVRSLDDPPSLIRWDHYHNESAGRRCGRHLISVLVLIGTIVVWFCLYLPFYQITLNTVGAETMYSTAVSLFVPLGNALLGVVVCRLTEFIGFRRQSRQRVAQLILIIPCVLLNCVMDFFVVTYVSWKKTDGTVMQTHAQIAKLHGEWFDLLFPGYFFTPYILEPLCTIMFVMTVGIWRIKRDKRITPEEAGRLLVASQADIVNPPLCDLICVPVTVIVTFVIAPGYIHRWLFPFMGCFSLLLYMQCRTRILRWESDTYYGSNRLHSCESAFWSLPLGLLAAAWERQHHTGPLNGTTGWRWFLLHVFAHLAFLRYVLPTFEPNMPASDLKYRDAIRHPHGHVVLADYLNTNPIEVLKSHEQNYQGRRLVYYRKDKDYLQEHAIKEFDYAGEDIYTRNARSMVPLLQHHGKEMMSDTMETIKVGKQSGLETFIEQRDRATDLVKEHSGQYLRPGVVRRSFVSSSEGSSSA